MVGLWNRIKKFWKDYNFEIIVILAVLFLFIYWFSRRGKQGSYSSNYTYIPQQKKAKFPRESRGEMQCRAVLQRLFNKPFPNVRPEFLKNGVTGKKLEIDCYNHGLRLGVEYSGVQHYKFVKGMHKNQQDFVNQRYRDEMKKRLCREAGVTLIEVPYTVKLQDIESYLKDKLRENGYSFQSY